MGQKEEAFMAKLMATFMIEADEHLKQLTSGLLSLEETADAQQRKELLETVFREAHSLKGAARAVNHRVVQTICQRLEDVLSALQHGLLPADRALYDILYRTIDFIGSLLADESSQGGFKDNDKLQALEAQLASLLAGPPSAVAEAPHEAAPAADDAPPAAPQRAVGGLCDPQAEAAPPQSVKAETAPSGYLVEKTIRVSLPKLDKLFQQVEELLVSKLTAHQQDDELKGMGEALQRWDKDLNHTCSLLQLLADVAQQATAPQRDMLLKAVELTARQQTAMKAFRESYQRVAKLTSQNLRFVSATVDALLDQTKRVLMQPFSTLAESFPRMVRDLSYKLGKEVCLEIQGGEIEVDRRILEELKDPLIHLISNAIDHGLEAPAQRQQLGKQPVGRIKITVAEVSGHNMELLIADDGRGIDVAKVKDRLLANGLIAVDQGEGCDDEEILQRLFHSNVSTSAIITEVSGRGLGLGIVAEKVDKLGGQVTIATKEGSGTTFRILLPLTLATFRGIQLKVCGRDFIVPTHNVKRILRIKAADVRMMENRSFIMVEGKNIPFIPLSALLSLNEGPAGGPFLYALVIKSVDKLMAFGADLVINEQEVFVKGLGKQLARIKNISAATVMEWGRVVPILNPHDLVRSALGIMAPPTFGEAHDVARTSKKVVLLAEDSMTTRMLLKNILEGAGYEVKAVVDGQDAYTLLMSEPVDLLLSDIEMPRMDGLQLTEKVRQSEKLRPLPVVLCTSRGSKEDRERGIAVGANAYLDKSSFTQSNLLDILKKLL